MNVPTPGKPKKSVALSGVPAGNTALLGAKLALLTGLGRADALEAILAKTRHVSLNEDPQFIDTYVDHMRFRECMPAD